MENNINKDIKKEFHDRKIKPSATAWSQLESKMAMLETTKEKNKYRFIAYAAVFIGLLVSLIFFVQQNNQVKENDFVTNSPSDNKLVPPTKRETIELIKEELEIAQPVEELVQTKPKSKSNLNTVKKQKRNAVSPKSRSESYAVNQQKELNPQKEEKNQTVITNTLPVIENEQIAQVALKTDVEIEQVKVHKKRKFMTSTDEELNALLATAVVNKLEEKRDIQQVAIEKDYLLYTIEKESDKKFGEKLMDKVKNGVHAVETYVTRNN